MTFSTHQQLILLDARRHGMSVTGYESHLAMLLALVDHGSIGDGMHSSAAHIDAIRQVIEQCNTVIAAIERANSRPAACDICLADTAQDCGGLKWGAWVVEHDNGSEPIAPPADPESCECRCHEETD